MRVTLPFGRSELGIEIPDPNLMAVATPPSKILTAADEKAEIRGALANPIGSPRLRDLASGKSNVVIIVSDYTRPTPSGKLVPPILEELEEGGVPSEKVTVIFAAGTHRPTKPEEMRSILGEKTYSRVRTLSHDCDAQDLVYVGITQLNGTPVWVNRVVAEADLRISVSSIEPHQSAGWSGGAKNILPGVSGRKTVMTHHAMSNRPDVRIGVLEGNPFREDLEEATSLVGLDFIVGAILTEKKEISQIFAGHWIEAHRAAVHKADKMLSFYLQQPADIVLASVGGAPRDSNLWQAEGKGLTRVAYAVRDGGVIILVAECTEGVGHPELAKALLAGTADEILEHFGNAEFTVFGNKAHRIASLSKKSDIYLVTTGLTADDLGQLPVRFFSSVETAIEAAFRKMGPTAQVVVVPRTAGVLLRTATKPTATGH